MGDTSIEWTDTTWNPTRGCSRVSPGCDNCYAMQQAHRFNHEAQDGARRGLGAYDGLTTIRRGAVDWSGRVRFVPEQLDAPLRWRKPRRVFVNSMSDLFHESIDDGDIAKVFAVMAKAERHTFQVLTKRAKRMREWFEWVDGLGQSPDGRAKERGAKNIGGAEHPWPLPNVWLGVSAEDQQRADERIPDLLATPAAVRFVSAEPLLGPIDLRCNGCGYTIAECKAGQAAPDAGGCSGWWPDWVIVGGESGHGARPCDVAWIRSIVAQCKAAGVACFTKQLGAFPHHATDGAGVAYSSLHGRHWRWDENTRRRDLEAMDRLDAGERLDGPGRIYVYAQYDKKGGDPAEWPSDLRVREFPEPA